MKLKIYSTDRKVKIGVYDEDTDTLYPIDDLEIKNVDISYNWIKQLSGDSWVVSNDVVLELFAFSGDIIIEI